MRFISLASQARLRGCFSNSIVGIPVVDGVFDLGVGKMVFPWLLSIHPNKMSSEYELASYGDVVNLSGSLR